MAVAPFSTKNYPQVSERLTESIPISHQPSSNTMQTMNNDIENPVELKSNQHQPVFLNFSFIVGITLGLLVGGVALSTVVTLWLTSPLTTTTTTSPPIITVIWNFNNNTNDYYNNYNGVAANTASYVTGYTNLSNTALNFISTLPQYVTISSPFLDLTNKSFTVEIWFCPTTLTSGDYGLFGQCQTTGMDQCLMYLIRNYYVYLGFYADDQSGVTTLSTYTWYHVAFVYDYSISTQSIYLNGILESSRLSNPYQGSTGAILIGAISNGTMSYFSGYIDQVFLVTQAKTASEILNDATLVCYYSFDSSPYSDSGPLGLNALAVNTTAAVGDGRINNAISFASAPSYFVVGGLTRLGTIGQAYSISIWINPTSVSNGTIAHVSSYNYNCIWRWCLAFIGFTSSGQIAIQSWSNNSVNLVSLTGPTLSVNVWTHIAQTYSQNNGMRLFVNGTLVNQSNTFLYWASGVTNYLYLGSFPVPICVSVNTISMGQYYGLVDEFYLFSRELTATEVSTYADP